MKRGELYRVAAALLLLSILALKFGGNAPSRLFSDSLPVSQAQPVAFRDAIYQVVEEVKPEVVQVTNKQVGLAGFGQSTAIPVGVGSGIVYDAQGYILTNNHVVEGANKLIVSLPNGRALPATIVGRDPQTDLAVIQIKVSNLTVAELVDSGQVAVGDWVVAIGNALALPGGPTVTAGLVSATGRTIQESPSSNASQQIPGSGPYLFDLIQTDAAINPVNAGGPLVNLDGQVIGINTLGGGSTGTGVQAQGIGFAIGIAQHIEA